MQVRKLISRKNREVVFIILLFATAFLWRSWYGLSHFSFQQDLARDILITEQWHSAGKLLVEYGPKTSIGNFNLPPLYYQLYLVLAYLLPGVPFAMFWLTILVESVTPVVLYLLLKKLFNKQISQVLATMYIFFSLPMIFGSYAWNPNMIPFFTTLSLWCYLEYFQTKKGWLLIPAVCSIAVAINFHYQAVILLPFSVAMLAFTLLKDRKNLQYWIIAVLLSLLTVAGYVKGELQNGFENTQHIVTYFTTEHSVIYERVSKPAFVLNFLPNFIERVMTGNVRYYNLLSIGRVVFLLGLPAMAWITWKDRKHRQLHLFFTLYFASVLFMLRVYKGDKLDYYMSPLFILAPFLLGYLLKLHKLFIVVVVVTIFYMAQFLITTPKINQYQDVQVAAAILDEMVSDGNSRFYFYNSEDINTFAFGLQKFTDITIDQQDTDILEVCSFRTVCIFDSLPQCKYSHEYSQLAVLKYEYGYQLEEDKYTEQYQIIKGTINNSAPSIEFYKMNQAVGSDVLLPQLYE